MPKFANGGAWGSSDYIIPIPKKTRQGQSTFTKLSATSRNKKKKAYRGQGK